MIKKLLTRKQEALTKALIERGEKQLFRLSVIIDVLYALMIYKLFTFMPSPDTDGFGRSELMTILKESYLNYTVIFIGLVLVLIYWGLSNLQFGNLKRTTGTHSTLSILQIFALMLYIYFVRLDAQFEGEVFLMQMQSFFLALAGFLSVYSWYYAIKNDLLSGSLTSIEIESIYYKIIPEPIVALCTFPLAYFGPAIWTLGWLLLLPVNWALKKYSHHLKFLKQQQDKLNKMEESSE